MKKFVPFFGYFVFVTLCTFVLSIPLKSFWRDPEAHSSVVSRALLAFERTWYDIKSRINESQASSRVMVATVDDASLKRFGRWPWSRSVYADILKHLYEAGASVVAFDAVFSEPELNQGLVKKSFQEPLVGLKKSLAESLRLKETDLDLIAKNLPEIGDRIFAAAIGAYPHTVLGYIWLFDKNRECPIYDKDNPRDQKKYGLMDTSLARSQGLLPLQDHEDSLGALYSQSFHADMPSFNAQNKGRLALGYCVVGNRSSISALAKHSGAFNTIHDEDGIVRRAQLLFGFDPESLQSVPQERRFYLPQEWFEKATFFPSLSLRTLMAHWRVQDVHIDVEETKTGKRIVNQIKLKIPDQEKPLVLSTLPDASLMLRFYGRQDQEEPPIKHFSLADLEYLQDEKFQENTFGKIKGRRPLENTIVFIGPTALGVYDMRPTPIQQDLPGVFIQATTTNRILDYAETGRLPGLRPLSFVWHAGLFIFLAALMGWFCMSRHFWKGLFINVVILASMPFVDLFIFSHWNRVWHLPTFWLLLTLLVFLLALYRYFSEERQKSFVKLAFQKYVSPDVVQAILADPENLNLGGEKQTISLLFSDIRGFTTFAETMEASELSKFLNEYLSEMTDIIMKEGGTIDKYIGDAIVAIFGAPVRFPDHADRALRAAHRMIEKLEELNQKWGQEGKPSIRVGIGINSGEASVGNMGSKQIFSYTAVGDAVNLASRLETLNKQFGTQLLVSSETLQLAQEKFNLKLLDKVKVSGKKQSVEIYAWIPPAWEQAYQQYREAFRLYSQRHFKECLEMLETKLDFPPASNLVRRCELFLKEAPGPDWDGAWTIQEK